MVKRQREMSNPLAVKQEPSEELVQSKELKKLLKECQDEIKGLLAPSKDRIVELKKHKEVLHEKLKVLEAKLLVSKVDAARLLLASQPSSVATQ